MLRPNTDFLVSSGTSSGRNFVKQVVYIPTLFDNTFSIGIPDYNIRNNF